MTRRFGDPGFPALAAVAGRAVSAPCARISWRFSFVAAQGFPSSASAPNPLAAKDFGQNRLTLRDSGASCAGQAQKSYTANLRVSYRRAMYHD